MVDKYDVQFLVEPRIGWAAFAVRPWCVASVVFFSRTLFCVFFFFLQDVMVGNREIDSWQSDDDRISIVIKTSTCSIPL